MHPLWEGLDRRQLIGIGTAAPAALALPGTAAAMMAQGFTHGVAGGGCTTGLSYRAACPQIRRTRDNHSRRSR